MWKIRLAAAAMVLCLGSAADAATIVATWTGTVGYSLGGLNDDYIDTGNLFGGGDLTGDNFTAIFSYDTSTGTLTAFPGGLEFDGPPFGTSLTISGHELDFDQSGGNRLVVMNDASGHSLGSSNLDDSYLIQMFGGPSMLLPSSFHTSFAGADPCAAPTACHAEFELPSSQTGFFLNQAFVSLSVTGPPFSDPSPVPEPSAWVFALLGFGGIGALSRRARRRRALSEPASMPPRFSPAARRVGDR